MIRLFTRWMEGYFQGMPDRVRKKRGLCWSLFILATLAIAPGVQFFQLDISDEFFFQTDDPVRLDYQRYRAQFGGDESIYIVYRAKDGDIFSDQSLLAVRGIQQELNNYQLKLKPGEHSALDHLVEVTSLINISYLEASEDSLLSRQFIGDRLPGNEAEREAYRQAAQQHPDYPLTYLDKNSAYGAILIRTDFKARSKEAEAIGAAVADGEEFDFDITELNDADFEIEKQELPEFEPVELSEYSNVMKAVQAILQQPSYTQVLEYFPIGPPVINAVIWDNFIPQINVLMLVSILLVIAALWLLFRSFAAVAWPILIFACSALLSIALMGWLGLKMNLMVNVTVLLCLVVGVADAVHIISGYSYFRHQGHDHQQSLRLTYEKSGMALFLTSVTTSIGMLALWIVPVAPIQHFGMSAALAVMFAFVITVFMLPLMLDLWHPVNRRISNELTDGDRSPHLIQRLLLTFEHMSYARPKLNITIFALLTLICLFGINKIEVDSDPVSIFAEDSHVRTAYDLVDDIMGGTNHLEIMIEAGVEDAFQDPRMLNAIASIQSRLENEFSDTVRVTHSLVNIVKDSNKSLHAGDPAYYAIPQQADVLRQTLFMFNNANPADRSKVVSSDYSKGHITVHVVNRGSKYYVTTIQQMHTFTDELLEPLRTDYPDMRVTMTGSLAMFAHAVDFISWSQIKGFGLAFLIITLIMLFIFPPIRTGMVAMIPNAFPIVFVFAMMGYTGIALDIDTLIVAPLMIGIVVDDTIHFLTHYRIEVAKHGDIKQAIIKTFREVGQAMTFTSIILAIAFSSFMMLDHQGLANFGMLSAVAIMVALAAELLLLPALLLILKVKA